MGSFSNEGLKMKTEKLLAILSKIHFRVKKMIWTAMK